MPKKKQKGLHGILCKWGKSMAIIYNYVPYMRENLPKIMKISDTPDCQTFTPLCTKFRATIVVKSAHNEGTKLPNLTQIATILVTKICLLAWG